MLRKISLFSLSCGLLLSGCSGKNTTSAQRLFSNEIKKDISLESMASEELWRLPELSQEEKQELIRSVQIVFNDFYVHRAQKKNDYGFDSQVEANKLSVDMSSEVLLKSINKIFNNVRDLHTGFRYPVPAQCVLGGFPLSVKLAYELNDQFQLEEKLVIEAKLAKRLKDTPSKSRYDEISFAVLKPGDEIIAISNLGLETVPVEKKFLAQEAIQELEKISRGSNEDASKTRAVQLFFSRSGAYMKPPSGRFNLTVKHASNNKVVTYNLPWILKKSASEACKNMNVNEHFDFETQSNLKNVITKSKNRFEEETFKDLYRDANDEEQNIVTSIIESNDHKKYALVHIKMFIPADVGEIDEDYLQARKKINDEVNALRNFVLAHRDEVEGLIFDVRENGGGYGVFPQLIANAFTTEFVSNLIVQPLVSKMNRDTFHNLEFSRFFKRFGTTDPLVDNSNKVLDAPISETANEMDHYLTSEYQGKDVILEPADRFDEDENDALPPLYTAEFKKFDTVESKTDQYTLKEIFTDKPIAVLTNSNCYSSCDIFVSIMKDYQIAKIIGETAHTGGGGANVVEWNNFAKQVEIDRGVFSPIIPNGKKLPKDATMRFAWNRIVRVKALDQINERYIEGGGVVIDEENVYKPSVKDVVTNDSVIFAKIMQDMELNTSSYRRNR